ncbi:phosphotransferase enzyme family protein [Sarocladium implicatum]|nr:phosphotransferase enzyme family protein [Sarocladium implicatum]
METPPASDFTVGIIYVKPLELMAVVPMLDHKYPPISAVNSLPYVYTLGQIGHHNVAIAGPARGQQGTVAIAHLAATLRSTFPNMTMGLLVGIGGGIPHLPENDVRLGDVVVSAPESGPHVVQYDLGKKTTNGFETSRFLAAPPSLLLQVVNHVEESMSSRADHEEPTLARHLRRISGSTLLSREYCKPMAPDRLFWADYLHQEGTDCLQHPEDDEIYREARPEEGDIVVHYSTILSGDSVMKCATERDALSRRYNNALCIEMEAAGAMDVFPCLVIRGISDYADSHKNSAWQKHAALAAAAYMRELLLQLPGTQPTKTLTQSHIGHGQCELIWRFPANELHHIQRALLQDSQEAPRRVMDHPPHSTWNIAASQKPALYVPEGMEFLANDLEDPHQALLPMTPQPQFAALPAVGPSSNSLWNILYPPDNVADMLPMRGIQEFARDNLPRVESCSSEPTQREWPVYCMEGLQVIGQIDISDSQSKRFFAEEQLQVVSVTMGINLRAQTHPFGVEEEGLTAYASVVTSDQELLQPTTSIMVRCNIHRGDHWGVELERLKSTAICKGLARLYNPLVKKRYALDFVTPILLAQGRDSIESTSLEDWGVGRPPPLLRLEPTLTEAWTRMLSLTNPVAQDAERRELTKLINMIDTRGLEARATHLRHGIACYAHPLQYDSAKRSSVMEGINYHIEVRFEDGITWIARIRRFNAGSPPPALRDYIVKSEVATLKFLEKTSIPAPRVHDFALEHPDNHVGVGFILMDKLPGKFLRWPIATQQQKRRVMAQLADTFVELHKYPLDLLGSLDDPGGTHIGAFARPSLTDSVGSEMRPIGPFSNLEEYHTSDIRLILDLIVREEMYSQQAVNAFLTHRYLLDLVPRVLPATAGDDKFYLQQADDKGDHILVDEDYNITGIIDWEWALTASPAHAFNSPLGFLPVGDLYDGKNDLCEDEVAFARLLEEKGRGDLARYVWNGRLQHRFAFCCGYDLADWDGFLGLFRGLRDAAGVDEGLEWDEWKTVALQRYQDDPRLQLLLSRHQDSKSSIK